jgi:triosephosphate isomerase (TIM)
VATRMPLMAGNWKCNLNHLEAIALVQKLAFSLTEKDLETVEVALLPPFTDIRSVQTLIDGDKLLFKYGAQDVSTHDGGAYTGEVTGGMLAKLGCSYAVVGHSERRHYHDETDAEVNLKVKAAFRHGLVPILCVGEDHDTRREKAHIQHTLLQVEQALHDIPVEQARTLVIAYEPIWAIGTGEVASPEDAQEMALAIRSHIEELYDTDTAENVRILYGGSVKAANVGSIMAQPDVDGVLVGGASIVAEEFVGICRFETAPV